MTKTPEQIAAEIAALPGVEIANAWTRVPGKEAIYIELVRYDAKGNRYGNGGGKVKVDITTGRVLKDYIGYANTQYFNSYTMTAHEKLGTTAAIREIIAAA